ncbi:MAG TPA: HD domain-containing phosphohydrolase [Thermoanaerobaculia bacterium]|nr:HD domain-containing phosphohydrolase [Thermoanaerobaculia bacterium]
MTPPPAADREAAPHPPAPAVPRPDERPWRPKLRHLLFAALLVSGIIPLAVASFLLVRQNKDVLEAQERLVLVTEAGALAQQVSGELASMRKLLAQLGQGLLAGVGESDVRARLREPWVGGYLNSADLGPPQGVLHLRVLDDRGEGLSANVGWVSEPGRVALVEAYRQALASGRPVYQIVPPAGEPAGAVTLALAVPVARRIGAAGEVPLRTGGTELVVEALVEIKALGPLAAGRGADEGDDGAVGAALVDAAGRVLWRSGIPPSLEAALVASPPLHDFVTRPLAGLGQYPVEIGGEVREMLVQISPIEETGWGLVAQKPLSSAFQAVDQVVSNALWSTLVLVLLASFFAALAARRVSEPVQRLAASSHEIAAGNFGRRVEVSGPTAELAALADDFNLMGEHVGRYVEELQRAAAANRELFIGSLRSFAAAIDAKDPYTRGHSERVAALARTIARHLNLPDDQQHRVWIAALLHDVGKIGVDDRILKKGGVLSAEEFEQMKAHTLIGAEILSPIEQLRAMIPAVRWHHENWNGRGYPDGLKAEQIPLYARIVAVADTFDAVTTDRPYQRAFDLDEAVGTIRRLVGSRFDAKVVTAFLRAYERGEVRVAPLRPRAVSAEPARRPPSTERAEARGG